MRVMGKHDIDNAILFDDLKTLLEGYGVYEIKSADVSVSDPPEVASSR